MRIAILGAGSYVSRAILPYLLRQPDCDALLYTRMPDQLMSWAIERQMPVERMSIEASKAFGGRACDVVVNFVGAGDPRLVNRLGEDILPLTVEWDERVLRQLSKRPSTRYIFFSSGVATGDDFAKPRTPNSPLKRPAWNDFYARAKAAAEGRHRKQSDLSIVDLRLYGFYSADMDVGLGYLVCSILQMVQAQSPFITDEHDIARDFLHPRDISSAIMTVLGLPPGNSAYDLASLGPVRKFDLLRRFQQRFDLQWQVRPAGTKPNKMNYYSQDFALNDVGFAPTFSAIDAVIDQATVFLARSRAPQLASE